ncbi:IMPACT family protein [Dermabacter sp. p3-SID358]|uniref:IMPACT family protein n=1 Tax=Dermabacter sp. p3-SID358 TaxID=2916114 RepID=UPI0021A2D469|nr:YigZ family protein [Dermabacter sp. p3-SID358]MCT1866276.1 IMPACT family protein [Dermabacter sp. p3-SID358]
MPDILETMPEASEPMFLLTAPVENELVITKSRFIAYLAPIETVDEADHLIRERRAMHPNARHHCTALTLGTPVHLQRSNDDGEPSSTAGMPMAQAMRGRHMTNILAVVTRYFGGIKLGAGGLVRAYGNAVTDALDVASSKGLVRERVVRQVTDLEVGYELAGTFEASIRAWAENTGGVSIEGADYTASGLTLRFVHRVEIASDLERAAAELSSGAVSAASVGYTYADVPAQF